MSLRPPERPDAPVTVTLPDDVTGAPADLLQVFVGAAAKSPEGRVAMAGRVLRERNTVTFTPAFGFVPGTDYVARVPSTDGEFAWVPFRVPEETASADAVVTSVFPSADVLPENTLRFYLHFSVPMAPHVAFRHIALRDASGAVDDAAFMRFKQELWSEDRTRLTVLIDPGRIKREVATNVERGPALESSRTYQLTVAAGWPSADGRSKLAGFSKSFSVSSPLRQRPSVLHWRANSPMAGTRETLEVALDRPYDRHRLPSSVGVVTAAGRTIRGTVEVGEDEFTWRFFPDDPWPDAELRIVVDPTLEDVAGNNFRDLLDEVVGDGAVGPLGTCLSVRLRSSRETAVP